MGGGVASEIWPANFVATNSGRDSGRDSSPRALMWQRMRPCECKPSAPIVWESMIKRNNTPVGL
ncbi:hypothetical protein CH063_11864 [Colletotrichum higginsianum]|uniref:Uncharacterized protein n=1 Tax=Colletotrichum higginsianum (strain IMI 349063) TaxID=759273 RepID=H1VN42_COLHI|nr:hypothetical protein CH63R_12376 [Colletotrichum higginsianum IMI 349063]OBR03249.1 hypothetical protein CH63R_12376 [Colletotrichum higginsianum IMI 349063]CCF41646.1 hypothetical protein CH063_11864 [Colletotrichum higginsianum]